MPRDEAEWLEITAEKLILRRCCYWISITGLPETDNATSVTVSIPRTNVLDVRALKRLMNQARTGGIR